MDISFCDSKKGDEICPKRGDCKRHTDSLIPEKWSMRQSFLQEAPFVQKLSGVSCSEFLSVNNDK